MNRQTIVLFLLLLLRGSIGQTQTVIRLYDGKASGSETWTWDAVVTTDSLSQKRVVYDIVHPTLTAFRPAAGAGTGAGVIICPGGNWRTLFVDSEGTDLARQLSRRGITAFVLSYRLIPRLTTTADRQTSSRIDSSTIISLAVADVKKAVNYVRQQASVFGIQPNQIGVMGVSSASRLALSVGQQHEPANRPDFIVPLFPRIGNFVGTAVTSDAPPLFICAVAGDSVESTVPLTRLYTNWLRAGRSAELHLYARDQPGFGASNQERSEDWMPRLVTWIQQQRPSTALSPLSPKDTVSVPAALPVVAVTSRATDLNQRAVSPAPAPAPPANVQSTKEVLTVRSRSSASGPTLRLSGTVRDSASGKPLAGATIVVDYRKRLTGTSTNADGRFSIDLPPGEHTVVARLVGYTPVRKIVRLLGEPVAIRLNLITVESQLEEVVVTTKGFDQTVRQPVLGVNQLNVNALRKLPAALGEVDLLRGLQSLPGVTSVGEASNGVNIRGGTTDQNLILLDDTPIFNPTHMFGLFSVFPPDVLNTVDLYKGNVPARFGGRAASVLDVSLRNPSLDQFKLSGGISVVSNKLTADIPIVKGKLGLLVSGRGAFNDFLLPIVSDRLANIRARFGDGVVKAFWRVNDRNTVTATGYGSKDVFQTELLANLPNVSGTATRYDHQTVNAMVRWFSTLSPRLNLQTTGVYVHYVPKILSPELSGNTVALRSSVLQRQLSSNLNYQLRNQKIEIGLSGTHYRIEPGTLLPGRSESVNPVTTPTENALELALYTDYERSLGDRLAVSAGLRLSGFLALGPSLVRSYRPGEPRDDFSVVDSTHYGAGQVSRRYGGPEPRLGLRYTLGPNASVKFGYNLMRQYLQVVTNTTTPLPTSRWKTADANIRPQVSQLLTAGYFLNFHQNVYELTVEGYWRTTGHIIDYRPGADFLLQPFPETQLLQGRSRAYGIETMISRKKGELTGWINYTYARTLNQVDEGSTIEQNVNGGTWYRANYDRPHTVNASLTIDADRHNSFGFTFALSTGRPYSAPTGFVTIDGAQYPYYGVRNNERLPLYHRFDLTWNIYNPGMRNRRWEGRWAFTLYNLYGHKNAYSIFFKTENGKTNAYQLQIFAAPIVSLAYNFVFK